MHRVIKFKQENWLKLYIHTNAEVMKKKIFFWKRFFQVDEDAVFGNDKNCEKT